MTRSPLLRRLPAALAAATLLLPTLPAEAVTWRSYTSPHTNYGVATAGAGSYLSPAVCSDGRGGMWVAYVDDGGSSDAEIVVRRLAADGTSDVTRNLTSDTSEQGQPQVVASDSGGVFVVWQDARNYATAGYDIYVQYVGPEGLARWTANGVQVTNATGTQQAPYVGRGFFGLIVGWLDDRNGSGNSDVYYGTVSTSGVVSSLSGTGLCTNTYDQAQLTGTPVGDGLCLVWYDNRNGNPDIFGDYVTSIGSAYWSGSGGTVCTATGTQADPAAVGEGSAGIYVVWEDVRGADYDIYFQRVVGYGDLQFGTTGAVLCDATLNQFDPEIASDGTGGAIVAWLDDRAAPARAIYAQRLAPSGSPLWTADGVNVASGVVGTPTEFRMVADGLGGVFVVWSEARVAGYDLYGQRLSSTGTAQWGSAGVLISGAYQLQWKPSLVVGSENSLQLAWEDERQGSGDPSIYAQRVDRYGYLGDAAPELADVSDVLGDQGGQVRLDWTPGYVEYDPYLQVSTYYVLRQVPAALAARMQGAGAWLVREPAEPARGERVILERTDAAATTYWEYVGQAPAFQSEAYSYVAPTTSDSVPGVPASTQFMVQARNSSGSRYWFSNARSGYSLDNLAPLAPAPFAGEYAGGTTRLAWDTNRESDLAGYRLYRGLTADFAPGPGNLVAALADTGYADAAGAPYYYKLTAVDVHLNESPAATLLPSGTADAGGHVPAALALDAPWPNPAARAATLRFALPRAGAVRLALFDASGREVRTLVRGALGAGVHSLSWDLRDRFGGAVPPGLYLARLDAAGRALVRRLLVVH